MGRNQVADRRSLVRLSSEVVTAYVQGNPVPATEMPVVIRSVYSALARLTGQSPPEGPTPFVPINKSITANHIICLEDGKKLRMLKRYLRTRFNLSPEE